MKYDTYRSKERHVDRGFSQKEGINYEETLAPRSKVHFHQKYHGTCFHDEVRYIPDGCKYKTSLMV